MIQLKVKDYRPEEKRLLAELLSDAMQKFCIKMTITEQINNCESCPGKRICRDINRATAYLD